MSTALLKELYEELGSSIRGDIYARDEPGFEDYSTIFNGNVKSISKAVAVPLDASDISKIVLFCNKHGLSPSIKAGGYGTAGWAIGGDIIVDLSKIVGVDIEPPNADGSYTSLKDSVLPNNKGKEGVFAAPSGKRRRQEDVDLRRYDQASQAVATFLRGPGPVPVGLQGGPPPNVRRRVEVTQAPPVVGWRQISSGSDTTTSSSPRSIFDGTGNSGGSSPSSTIASSPSPGNGTESPRPSAPPLRASDPFGYLKKDNPICAPASVTQASYPSLSMHRSWIPSPTLFGNHPLPPGQLALAEPVHPHAYVTFGAGMRQKEIDTYTAQHKLEARYSNGSGEGVPYHVPFSAHPVGSSIMILGGFGFLSRLRGLSIDNLVEVEMVLADGRIVIVNEEEYPDLWWAIRGAGPALGIATRYKAKAYPVPVVFAGNLIYRFNRATAPSLIKHFRDCVKGAPRELYANVLLTAGPAGKDSLVVVQMCYVGTREQGQEYLAAISSWDGEQCLLNEVDEKSFLHQQDSVAQVLRGKAGRQWFIRSALITSLPDDLINETVINFADTPVGCTWLFELAGGAIIDFEDTCVPKSQREASFTIAALHQWEMDVDDDRCVESAEEWIADTLKPVHQGGPFPSFLGRHEPPERVKACFGSNWERLCEIKELYDPNNLFKNSFWPLNAEGEAVEAYTHEPPTP
ncbi:FAD-linked oxidoreductase [Termitomyces sp. T112]|nr:FAD-linked oxidoreductase [Termitomyces sp. T112]